MDWRVLPQYYWWWRWFKCYFNQGFGEWLLVDALQKLLLASESIGFPIVMVDARDGAKQFVTVQIVPKMSHFIVQKWSNNRVYSHFLPRTDSF